MKIAIDLTSLADNFSGIERYAMNIALAMLEQDDKNEYHLIFKKEIFPDFRPWIMKNHIVCHVLSDCKKLFFNQWRLPRFLNRLGADYYLFFAFPMPVLLHSRRVIGTIHDMGCWDYPETMKKHMVYYFRFSYRWMVRKAERILTISEFSKKRIQDILNVSEERIMIAYCGLSEEFLSRKEYSEDQRRALRKKYHLPEEYFLCLSTLEPRKNMKFLLEVYAELLKQGKITTKLVLAGRKGWKTEDLLHAVQAEKEGQVIVTGFIEKEDLPAIYQMAKCFIFPSIYEGFGIPPLEALSQGVPVIATRTSSMPEILGASAHYYTLQDRDSLKNAILEFEASEQGEGVSERRDRIACSKNYCYNKEAAKLIDYLYSKA